MNTKLSFLSAVMFSVMLASPLQAAAPKNQDKEDADTYELLNLFGEVMERAKISYVEEVSDRKLIESAINGMLVSLDPHSSYLDEQSFKYMSEQTSGKFGGLGIEVTMENSVVKVVSPIDDTPAAKAGLKPGDYITSIDGEQVMGLTLNEAVDKMRGKVGTKVKLTIRRASEKPFDVTLKREEIKIQSVKSEVKSGDVAYIRVSSFSENIDKMIEKAVKDARKKTDGKLAGVVLDVRNNPGGLLDQAVSVSDLFLDNESDTIKYTAEKGDIVKGLPIVVLINEGSASASEIVAGALQDHHRAIVMGEKSFGKGSVQTVIPLGKYGAMRLTTARYYTPSGRSIQAKGIEPDIEVRQAKLEVVESGGFGMTEAELKGALKNETAEEKKAEKDRRLSPEDLSDYQLLRAIDMVKALKLYSENDSGK